MPGSGHGFGVGLHLPRGGEAAWTPGELGSAVDLWVRPEELTAIGQGNPISTWTDVGPNTNHLTQAGDPRPTVDLNILDGYAGALFDNVDDYMVLPDITETASDWEIFVVHSPKTYKSAEMVLGADNTSTASLLLSGKNSDYGLGADWKQWGDSSGLNRQELMHYHLAENDVAFYLNGVSQTQTAGDGDWAKVAMDGVGANDVMIGAGGGGTPGNFMDGHLHEMIIFRGVMTYDQRRSLLTYFAAKYPTLSITIPPESMTDIDTLYAWYVPEDLPVSGAVTTWPNTINPGTFDLVSDLATDPQVGTGNNGVRSVLFSQVTTEALSTAESTNFTQPLHYFVVCVKTTGTETVSLIDSNAGTNRIAMYDPSGDNNCYIYAGDQQATNLIPLNTVWKTWECLVKGADTRYWLNNNEGTVGDPGDGSIDGLRVGLTGIATGPWHGEVCEVIFFDGEVTEVERQFIHQYISAKYTFE